MKSGEVSIHNALPGVSQFTVFPTVTATTARLRPLFGPLRNNPNDTLICLSIPEALNSARLPLIN